MENLIIYHTQKKEPICPQWLKDNDFVLWETCVRQIVIGTSETKNKLKNYHSLKAIKAYRFILEVICGLHSPMIGETEVLCQFKNFISQTTPSLNSHILDQHFWDGLLKDAKIIRSKYLKGYGQQSYGGIVLQNSSEFDSIHFIGSGQLTASILPHFSREKREINIFCRTYLKGKQLQSRFPVISEVRTLDTIVTSTNSLLVVAAPISTAQLEEIINRNHKTIHGVIDLRSPQDHRPLNKSIVKKYMNLDQIFNQVQSGIDKAKESAKLSKVAIARRSFMWPLKIVHRPNGWEDLCA